MWYLFICPFFFRILFLQLRMSITVTLNVVMHVRASLLEFEMLFVFFFRKIFQCVPPRLKKSENRPRKTDEASFFQALWLVISISSSSSLSNAALWLVLSSASSSSLPNAALWENSVIRLEREAATGEKSPSLGDARMRLEIWYI
jgi:hypothetical protein